MGVPADLMDATFSKRGWLSLQHPDFRQTIIKNGRLLKVLAGESIFFTGDEAGGIYGILSGAIGCEMTTPISGPTLVHIMQTGWWFGEGPMVFDRRRTMTFMALEDSTLLLVPLQSLRAIASGDAQAASALGQIAEIAAVLAIEAGCELLIRDARQRISAVLLRVTAALQGVSPANPRGFRITQSQLAEMSNVSRHYTNVALIELQAAGYVMLDYGRINVLEPQRLAAFAGSA